jgi:hypothetical protein
LISCVRRAIPFAVSSLGVRVSWLSLSKTFPALLLLGLLSVTARRATDPDLWWHLRTGQWIVETGHIPHADPFSFTRAGQTWVSHEWLSEVVFYEIWKHAGAAGLIVFASVMTTVGFMLLYWRCPTRPHWAAAATVLGVLASAPAWGVRPQMFTFTLTALLLWLIERGQARPRFLLWIVLLFPLWLNLHAGFAMGPALLVAYCLGLMWEMATGEATREHAGPHCTRLVIVLLACLALVPLNPSGAQLYRYPLDVLRSAGMRAFIVEWFPPDFHQPRYAPFLLIWLVLLFALAGSRSRSRARVLVPLLLTALAALDAVRHIPIFVLLAVPVIAAALPVALPSGLSPPSHPISPAPKFRLALNGAALALMAVFTVARWDNLARNQAAWEAELYPQKAVAYLQSRRLPGRAFVYYDWGGYAIWKLYPGYRVFVDGRADLYGDDLLRQFQRAVQLRSGWRQVLDDWEVETVLVPTSCALAQALLLDTHWYPEYRDSQATLLLRKHPAAANWGVF